jgi:ATP-binding cassette subfamily B (MDR/TAP) protein 1
MAKNGQYRKLYDYQSLTGERSVDLHLEKEKDDDRNNQNDMDAVQESVPEQKIQENAKRARLLAKDDIWLLLVGAFGAICTGLVFPAWGILFAYMIEVLYHAVLPCTGPTCPAVWAAEAREIQVLSYKVTWGWLGTMGLNILGQTLLYFGLGTAAEKMNKRVRDAAFTSIIRQDMAFFDQQKVGNLASQLQEDAAMIQSFSGEPIRSLIMSLSSVLVGLIISFIFMWYDVSFYSRT